LLQAHDGKQMEDKVVSDDSFQLVVKGDSSCIAESLSCKVGHQKCGDQQITCTSGGSTGNLLIPTFLVAYI